MRKSAIFCVTWDWTLPFILLGCYRLFLSPLFSTCFWSIQAVPSLGNLCQSTMKNSRSLQPRLQNQPESKHFLKINKAHTPRGGSQKKLWNSAISGVRSNGNITAGPQASALSSPLKWEHHHAIVIHKYYGNSPVSTLPGPLYSESYAKYHF